MINARRFSCAHVLRAQQRWLTDLPYQPEAYGSPHFCSGKKFAFFRTITVCGSPIAWIQAARLVAV